MEETRGSHQKTAMDVVFRAVVAKLPEQLKAALYESGMCDAGMLAAYPRTPVVQLAKLFGTALNEEPYMVRRATSPRELPNAASSSAVSPFFPVPSVLPSSSPSGSSPSVSLSVSSFSCVTQSGVLLGEGKLKQQVPKASVGQGATGWVEELRSRAAAEVVAGSAGGGSSALRDSANSSRSEQDVWSEVHGLHGSSARRAEVSLSGGAASSQRGLEVPEQVQVGLRFVMQTCVLERVLWWRQTLELSTS